jgi:hypothetical protein
MSKVCDEVIGECQTFVFPKNVQSLPKPKLFGFLGEVFKEKLSFKGSPTNSFLAEH